MNCLEKVSEIIEYDKSDGTALFCTKLIIDNWFLNIFLEDYQCIVTGFFMGVISE